MYTLAACADKLIILQQIHAGVQVWHANWLQLTVSVVVWEGDGIRASALPAK